MLPLDANEFDWNINKMRLEYEVETIGQE